MLQVNTTPAPSHTKCSIAISLVCHSHNETPMQQGICMIKFLACTFLLKLALQLEGCHAQTNPVVQRATIAHHGCTPDMPFVASTTSSKVMLVSSPRKLLSSVKKSMQWHSCNKHSICAEKQKRSRAMQIEPHTERCLFTRNLGCMCISEIATHLPLAHRHTRAVPKALLRFELLVIVVSAGAQRCTKLVLVLCKPLHMAPAGLQEHEHCHFLMSSCISPGNKVQTSACCLTP